MITRRQSNFNEETLNPLIKEGASDRLALLAAKNSARSVAETLAAMANADGGLAVLGVTHSGTPQKNIDSKLLLQMVAEASLLSDPPLILPSAQTVLFREGEVVVVEVPAGLPHVYSLQGSYLTRTAGQNRPLTTPELRRLLLDRGDRGYESQPVEGATLSDLDNGKINRYLDHIAAPPDANPVQMLQARGCVVNSPEAEPTPTAAGLLLFGRDPHRFIRSSEIICVRYAGESMSDEFVRQDISGALPDQLRQAEAFVTANVAADAIADPYAIVVADSGFVGTWAKNDQALDFLQRTCEWRLPAQRPAFAQGMVAGLPMKLWFAEDEVLLMVAAPYASDLLERMQGSH